MTRVLSESVKEKNRIRASAWYHDNKEYALKRTHAYYNKVGKHKRRKSREVLRTQVLDAYGRECSNCGYADERALDLDHINGRKVEGHRKLPTNTIYQIVIRENFPRDKYRILCRNCNWIEWLTSSS